eukprot:CAMPEP_0202914134 /NCGR_PEP_ID=MMETSP1392-20130828/62313_1 /ASSEMBLY_ACC=CAM_ASM_000868 /TAXON_ID=225041 /ORGANISM="Chlamydomonas chlamydogama, Strain SAG 11-48b" /LENGTH=71 /DNA_ID=CAMNT_0049605661 /DNA_START=8 /DNA_END=219 /DNA_ORIENTATION=+
MITLCDSVTELQALLQDHRACLNHVHAAVAFARMVDLGCRELGGAAAGRGNSGDLDPSSSGHSGPLATGPG